MWPSSQPASVDCARLFALPVEQIVILVSTTLQSMVDLSTSTSGDSRGELTRFHAKLPLPDVDICSYLRRLSKYLPASKDALFLSLLYIRRLAEAVPSSSSADPLSQPRNRSSLLRDAEEFRSLPSPERSKRQHKRPVVNRWTIHRLILGSVLVSSKVSSQLRVIDFWRSDGTSQFISDSYIPQSRAAKVGGVQIEESLALEVEILLQVCITAYIHKRL